MARADNIPSLFLFRHTAIISPVQNQTLHETIISEEDQAPPPPSLCKLIEAKPPPSKQKKERLR
jgi:hypothetical protein